MTRIILTRIVLSVTTVIFAVTAGLSAARSEPPLPSPVCVYKSETYGEGAYLYPNRLLLLTCAIDAGRPKWKVVPTSQLNDLRTQGSNPVSASTPERDGNQASDPPKSAENDGGQKCLAVNGKRYCQ